MHKQLGAILLVAGTCIGSGMIALPMVLAQIGLIPSFILMVSIWALMYFTSLASVELNLQAGQGLSLGALGRHFSGRFAESIGTVSLKLLSYALLAAYLYGGSSVLQKLLFNTSNISYELGSIARGYAIFAILFLMLPLQVIDYVNRLLFIALIAVVGILIGGLSLSISWMDLPLFAPNYSNLAVWPIVLPVVFTSFGFQVIFHTLTNYCHRDPVILKRAFFWGSLVPGLVYLLWTSSTLTVLHHSSPVFYATMVEGSAEVGTLIQELSLIAKGESVQLLVWWISLLAIVTSVLGVSVGLYDSVRAMITLKIPRLLKNFISAFITISPAYIVASIVPNAFISVLGFAGMILVIIAILLPIYLLSKVKAPLFYKELRHKILLLLSVLSGFIIFGSEIFNLLKA